MLKKDFFTQTIDDIHKDLLYLIFYFHTIYNIRNTNLLFYFHIWKIVRTADATYIDQIFRRIIWGTRMFYNINICCRPTLLSTRITRSIQ